MRNISILTVAVSALAVSNASAGNEPVYSGHGAPQSYFAMRGFMSMPRDSDPNGEVISYKKGGGMSAALGYAPSNSSAIFGRSRFEVEALFNWNEMDSINNAGTIADVNGHLDTTALMFNILYPIAIAGNWKPYIGAGAGAAYAEANYYDPIGAASHDQRDIVLAAQLRAGLQYQFDSNPNMYYTVGYRYFATQPLKVDGGNLSIHSHNIEMGIMRYF